MRAEYNTLIKTTCVCIDLYPHQHTHAHARTHARTHRLCLSVCLSVSLSYAQRHSLHPLSHTRTVSLCLGVEYVLCFEKVRYFVRHSPALFMVQAHVQRGLNSHSAVRLHS